MNMTPELTKLIEAADAVINRWDSPQWGWSEHGNTGNLIADLRLAKSKLMEAGKQSVPQPTTEARVAFTDEEINSFAQEEERKELARGVIYADAHRYSMGIMAALRYANTHCRVVSVDDVMEAIDEVGDLPDNSDHQWMWMEKVTERLTKLFNTTKP